LIQPAEFIIARRCGQNGLQAVNLVDQVPLISPLLFPFERAPGGCCSGF
jgi:hypothetical protein